MAESLKKLEERTFEEDDSPEIPPDDIVAYNELRSCADLYRMHVQKILDIHPEFQREIVWKNPDQTRFIDSLIKQLPIPSMCFSLDFKAQKWQVIDGLQRMASIIRFLSGEVSNLSVLDDVDPKLSGENISKFMDEKSELHKYYTRVENLTLPITVLRCDYSKKNHTYYLFTIFHRLNSGGMRLNNQEIRNCIYAGSFNNLLRELNKNESWMKINKMKSVEGHRFTTQELILRIFAFHDRLARYGGRLARFLNDYMDDNKNAKDDFIKEKSDVFIRTVDIVYKKIFDGKNLPAMPISVLEAILIGVSHNLRYLEAQSAVKIKNLYEQLLSNEEMSEEKLKEGISGKTRVLNRLTTARQIFSGKEK